MFASDILNRTAPQALPGRLARLAGRSLYGALLLMAVGGLAVPALVGGYFLIGVQEQQAARTGLDESLQRNADILALGMQESLWNMNVDAARSLVDSLMRDPAVLHVHVQAQADGDFIDRRANASPGGHVLRAEREVVVHGQPIGRVTVEMDDSRSLQELRTKQWRYAMVLAGQLAVSLLLIVLLLKRRLVAPLRTLMTFSDRLSQGRFDSPLVLSSHDELGRLGRQMERMRIAIGELFKDIGRREERFRSIVTQVPGAVFRARPGGAIDFVSDAIEAISGYPAQRFMGASSDRWADIIRPEDRREHYRAIKEAMVEVRPYEIEYRIVDADGIERWLLESGQPAAFDGQQAYWVDGIISDISERKNNEMRIEALLAEQGAVLDNVMFGIVHVRARRVVSTNRRFEALFGYGENELAGESVALLFPSDEEYAQTLAASYPPMLQGSYYSDERQFRRSDGSLVWCTISGRAVDPQQPDRGSIWVYADVTERRQAEEKLRLSATVLEHIADGVMVLDVHGRIVAINPAFTQITGYTEAEALGTHSSLTRVSHLGEASGQGAFHETLWRDIAETGFWRGETWNRRKNGEAYLEWLTVSSVRDDADVITHYVCVFSDVTKARESQDKLDHLAHHDALTGLPNRLLFHDRLQHAMVRAARTGRQLAVMFIDLDRFKTVNDTLGHHVGDELLKRIAHNLSTCLRDGDTLARLGGDEFIVLLEDVDGERGAAMVAEKLMGLFERPALVAEYELFVTGSVGISLFPQDASDLNILVRNADVAMYQAKARGRNGYQFYAPSMDGDGVERLRLEALLRRSIERGEMSLAYQPQVAIEEGGSGGTLLGVEALVRWHNAELGEVPPSRFIALAEDIGFITQLGGWVLEEACRQMMAWERAGLAVPKMAVNLSGRQFDRGSIAGQVRQVLEGTGLAPRRLQLEVTESVIMNTGDALAFINDLHALGVELAIDDFGTGYSSLAYLKQLPVQTLKIDRSFIRDIATDAADGPDNGANDRAIASAIIQLGKSLDLAVIAEGVESEAQAAFLLRHGCNRAQGYLYGRPMAPDRLLEQWRQESDARHEQPGAGQGEADRA